jgi:hypothetical protein
MLGRLFPKQMDNTYRGYWLAVWLFVPLVLVKLIMGFNVAGLNPWVSNRFVLINADGVPLDTFAAEPASLVVFLFSSWGLSLLLLSLLSVLALMRYRAMIPLMYLVLTVEQLGRKVMLVVNPLIKSVETQGIAPGTLVNWGLIAGLVIGLVLSLLTPQSRSPRVTAETA